MAVLSQSDIDEYLNETVGNNYRILSDVARGLKKERDKLHNQLLGRENETSDDELWLVVGKDARNVISQLKSLGTLCKDFNMKLSRKELLATEEEKISLLPLIRNLTELEQLKKYLYWIKITREMNLDITTSLSLNSMDHCVDAFIELESVVKKLCDTSCRHLKKYMTNVCEDKRMQLIDKLSGDMNEILKVINWPMTKDTSTKSLKLWEGKKSSFLSTFHHLFTIDRDKMEEGSVTDIFDHIPLPVDILLSPLRKRFKFHFYGDKQTNSKDKPEWYLTQVSTWINDHTQFIEQELQPALSRDIHLNIKVEFMRGLLQEVVSKVTYELTPSNHPHNNGILDDDFLTSHLIDELLIFEKELRTIHHYPQSYPTALCVLLEEIPLCRWLNLEKQFAAKKLKCITESSSAWNPFYMEVIDVDDLKVPECADKLMQLIAGISERFKQIPLLYVRLQFLELQSDLLLEFHRDLTDNVTETLSNPLSPRFFAYLNASHYISTVLNRWGEETFYLELHYYNRQLSINKLDKIENMLEQIELLRKIDPEYAQLEGTAFEHVVGAFDRLINDMIDSLVSFLSKLIRTALTQYRRERWHNMTLTSSESLELSPAALPFILKIQEIFHTIKTNVTHLLMDTILDHTYTSIDDIILQEV
jgi:hypothetical protein